MTQIERMKEIYKNLNLKEQLTDDMKSKWYYQERKWGLRINKKSVVFDDDFKFKIKYHEHHWNPEDFEEGEEVFEDEAWLTLDYYIDDIGETMEFYDDSRYSERIEDILKTILVYIANYI